MSYYEKRIAYLEARVAEMALQQRMKAIPIEAKLLERYALMQAENTRLKAEVERLKAMDSLKTVSLTDSTNWQAIGDYAEAKEENASLKAEVESFKEYLKWHGDEHKFSAWEVWRRQRSDTGPVTNLKSGADYFKAEEGKA